MKLYHVMHNAVCASCSKTPNKRHGSVFAARHNDSVVYAADVSVGLSIRLSVTSRYFIETTGRNEVVFDMDASFLLSSAGFLQNKGFSMWNFVTNSGLRKFRHYRSIMLSTKLVDGRACLPHLRRSTRRGCLLHVRNALTPLLRFVVNSLYNVFL